MNNGAAMEVKKDEKTVYADYINKFLNEFMLDMYKGHDHAIARKYFHDLFNELIPKYFCVCADSKKNMRTVNN